MSESITLTLPRERPFYAIAHLVLGGLAARLDLTFEHLEDLQLALDGVLDRHDEGGDVTVELRLEGDTIRTRIGPFLDDALADDLEPAHEGIGLRRLLDTVVDRAELSDGDGGQWIELTKTIGRAR